MFIKKFFSWFKKDNKIESRYAAQLNSWVKTVPNELEVDAIGLWQIIPVLREEFGLHGETLIKYTRKSFISHFGERSKACGRESR